MCVAPVYLPKKNITVPCGHCIECLQQRSVEWSYRLAVEAKSHEKNCFLTLTYNDDSLPFDFCVSRRELQLFVKRLRKEIAPTRVRFFGCGEYGKKRGRPHYHLVVFGWSPDDLFYLGKDKKGTVLYRSATVEKCWKKGFSSVAIDMTPEVLKYVAKYMQKRPPGRAAPFVQMSNRPGIGYNGIDEKLVKSDKLYMNGHFIKLPRYYLKKLEERGIDLTELKGNRKKRAEQYAAEQFVQVGNSSVQFAQKKQKYYKIFGKSIDKTGNI